MPKSDLKFNMREYAPVAERIARFYERHPGGRIVTDLISSVESPTVVVRARVYRGPEDRLPAATGLAAERQGDGEVNAVACVENTETSAIGRALANLGFTAGRQRASYEEMQKVARHRAARAAEPRPAVDTSVDGSVDASAFERLQTHETHANAVHDLIDLVAQAELAGLAPDRAARLRAKLTDGVFTVPQIERLERRLRHFIADSALGRDEAASPHDPTPVPGR